MKIGFIGLGNLGTPIAINLLEETRELYVHNRTPSKMEALREKGAAACNSVKELAARCDIVFTIVADDAALNEITVNPEGIGANLKEGPAIQEGIFTFELLLVRSFPGDSLPA